MNIGGGAVLEMKGLSSFLPGMLAGFVLGAIAMLVFLPLPSEMGFVREAHYATHTQAVAHGAVSCGWLPEFVPGSATDIAEIHKNDANHSLLRFRLPGDAREALRESLSPILPLECTPSAPDLSRLVDWWEHDVCVLPGYNTFLTMHRGDPCFAAISEESDMVCVWF
ncbi:MAG TPA: hypothetical protein PKY01_13955 [Candidatus Hydrogenedentes bacterium]|nr:hypothetical protein [Candidatus Hydrogenedentota bacterium]HQH53527.1 hypothetical protein [Candidatus Hydrogenedentota bacterium]